MRAVVVEDLSNVRPVGLVVEGVNTIRQAINAKCAMLPLQGEIPTLANSGWVVRHYGNGWAFQANRGERGCPLSLRVTRPGGQFVYWSAKISSTERGPLRCNSLRMVYSAERESSSMTIGLNQITYVDQTPALDPNTGNAIVYGKSHLFQPMEALLFVELYAVATNLSVKWFAISQAPEDLTWPI